ncbi:hypothetical protein [Flavobacterium sp. MK4S-17]|uniref:hypothetical protein n=1 Tax=Flavobacterium sp. MK4S-17 TaxID=2543737 RepID=UPI00135AE7D1|nr:hypothetical protein [Flavobacterium sp. MK4S-17]
MKKSVMYLVVSLVFISCQNSKNEEESELFTKRFFEALKLENKSELETLYPDFINFESYYKTDSINIKSSFINDDVITVSVHIGSQMV